MTIGGFQKLTLLDFPGKVACIVFFEGCNLRCPFCHNASLVTHLDDNTPIPQREVFDYLEKRRGIVEGVCLTGGEALMHREIVPFAEKIREMGYAIKLDTNGFYPERLKEMVERGLADYVAMDVKNTFEKYPETVGISTLMLDGVRESMEFLLQGRVPWEFRTTVSEEMHTPEDVGAIARMIRGTPTYYLQNFKDSGDLIGEGLHSVSENRLSEMREAAEREGVHTEIRG